MSTLADRLKAAKEKLAKKEAAVKLRKEYEEVQAKLKAYSRKNGNKRK